MSGTATGSASISIDRPCADVFALVSDITRMGEWSPENTGCRWVDGADGPALGARFEGDNIAKVGPITLKKWTTTSEITAYEPGEVFEFVAEGYTTWRFELAEFDGGTRLTESYSYPAYKGWQKLVYGVLARRPVVMAKGVEATLAGVKSAVEG
jgi:Polyketide cyclase / dehydrase and lipid transport